MRKVRFFVPLSNIKNDLVIVDGQEYRHLSKVLRLKVGDPITVLCDDENVRECVIVEITKDKAKAQIKSIVQAKNTGADITVYQALIKSEPLSFAVQKCTELGVRNYVPYNSEYGVVVDKGQIRGRLERIAEASCKQSGRVQNIKISDTQNFDKMCQDLGQYSKVVVAYEKDTTDAKQVLSKLTINDKIAVVIGSEGGFSPGEINKLKQLKNVSFVSLGRLILRAETAVLALVGAIKYELGEFANEDINVDTGV